MARTFGCWFSIFIKSQFFDNHSPSSFYSNSRFSDQRNILKHCSEKDPLTRPNLFAFYISSQIVLLFFPAYVKVSHQNHTQVLHLRHHDGSRQHSVQQQCGALSPQSIAFLYVSGRSKHLECKGCSPRTVNRQSDCCSHLLAI